MNFISPLSIISNIVLIFCYIFFSPTIRSLDLGHDLQKSLKMLKCAIGLEEEGRCIVDGGWSLWSVWGNCQGECGQVGRRVRQRTCNNPVPENGANCVGERQQFKQCSLPACNLEEYDKLLLNDTIRYSELKVLVMFNNTYPAIVTKCLAMNCAFEMVFNILTDSSLKFWNALMCVKLNTGCPVLGGWSPWGEWSRCNSRCGPGKRIHCRACKSPVPSSSEFDCRGENCSYETCMGTDCYIGPPQGGIWSEWSTWSGCSTTCGPGIQRRNRLCNAKTKFREHTTPPITWTKAKEKLPLNHRLYNDDYYYDDDLINNEIDDDNVAELVSHKKKHTKHLKNHHKAILEEKGHKQSKTAGKRHKSKNKTKSKSKKKIRLKTVAKGELNSAIINDNQNTFKETVIDEEIASIDNRSTEFLANYSDTNLTDNSLNDINTEQFTESVNLKNGVTHDTNSTTKTIPIVTDREILESTTVDKEIPSKSVNFRITRFNLKDILTAPSKLLKVHSECAQEDILGTTCACSGNSKYDMNTGFKLFSDEMATLPIMTKNPTVEPVIQEVTTNIPPITMEELANTKEILQITIKNSLNTAESLPFTTEVTTENSPITGITESTPFPTINLPIETECVTMTAINSPITSTTEKTPCPTENSPITSTTENTPCPTENSPITSTTEKTPSPTDNSPITSTTENTPSPTDNSPITSTTENTPCPTENSPITTIYSPSSMGNITITTVNSSITTEILTLTTENVTSTKIGLFQKIFTFPSFHKDLSTVSSTTLTSVSSNTILTTPESNPPPICNTPVVWSMPECRTTLPPITHRPRPIECMEDSVTLEPFNFPPYNTNFVLQDCTGPFEEIKPCQNKPCDVDGEWSSWSAWSDCSAECGIGSQVKSRSCSSPPPRGNGTVCLGSITLKNHCFMKPCPELTQNVAFFEEKNQLAFPKNEIPAHLLHMYIRFRPYKPTGYLIVRQENICENKCVTTELVLHAGYLVFRADVLDCTVTLVSRNILSVGDWHDALITIVGEVVSLRIDDNLLQLTDTLSCTPLYPDYDLPMIVGAGLLGEIDKVVINFVPVALNKKCDYTIPVNVQLPGRFPEDDTSVVFKPTEDEEAAHQSLEEFIQAPCFSDHLKWKVEIAVKPVENDGMIMLIPGDGDSDYLIVTLEQNRIRLRVKIGSDSADSVDNIGIVTTSWILLEIDKRENESISIAVNGNIGHGAAFPEGNEEDQFTIRCVGGILFGEVPASIKARVLTDALHYLPTHSVRGLLGLVAIDNEVQDLKNLPSKIPPASLELQPSDSYLFSSHTASKTAMYEQVEIICGETMSLTCLYNISNPDSEVNVYSKHRKTSDVVATWVKLDLTVEKAFENISGLTYSVFDNGRITRLTVKSYTSGDDIAGFYSCWVQSPTTNITGLNLITYGVSVIDPNLHFNSWQMGLLRYLGYLALLHAALMILWLIFECFVDLKKGSGYYRCRKLSLESEKNAVLKMINSKKGMKLLGSEFMVDAAKQRYLAQTVMDEEQRAINQDEEQRIKTAGQSVADLQKEHLNPTTTDEESDVPQKLVDIKPNHLVYQTRISQPTLTQVYRKTNDQIGPMKREDLNEKESRTNNRSKYNAKKKNVVFNKGYEPVNNDCDSEEEYLSKKQSMPCYLADINDEQDVGLPVLTKQNTIQENQKGRLRNRFPTNLMNKEENDFLKQIIYADLPTKVKYKQLNTTEDPSIGKITETPAYRKIESKMGKIIHKQSKIKNKDLFDVSY